MKKVCKVCGRELSIAHFPLNRRMPDGHLGWCFDCFSMRTPPKREQEIEPTIEVEQEPTIEPIEVFSPREAVSPQEVVPKKKRGRKPKYTPEESHRRKLEMTRRWTQEHREYVREYAATVYAQKKLDEEFMRKRREQQRKYRESDRGRATAKRSRRAYYLANKEKWVVYKQMAKEKRLKSLENENKALSL